MYQRGTRSRHPYPEVIEVWDSDTAEYDSDDDGRTHPCCWCQIDDERLTDARHDCLQWPGPTCGACWAARCAHCPYTFEDPRDAASRTGNGRLICAACAVGGDADGGMGGE